MTDSVPVLDGVHHLKLPVSDLAQSQEWYERVLGYRKLVEFVEDGKVAGIAMEHPAGGPGFALRLDPERAAAAAGFDYFSIGVPDQAAIEALAARLDEHGVEHAGVVRTTVGWALPMAHDPDGHEVRFYTTAVHEDAGAPAMRRRIHSDGTQARVELT